jgi:hypothetical protein
MVLTHDSKLDWITGPFAFSVCGHTRVIASVVSGDTLQDEAVVADNHARTHILHHLAVL